jgi:glycosyltransferase involved in cell wall biosynthesis
MRIFFLIVDREGPSTRYRVLQYLPFLEREGIGFRIEEIPRKWWLRRSIFGLASDFDVTFLQKRLFGWTDLQLLRRFAKRLVYDFDDAVMYRSFPNPPDSRTRAKRFSNTVRASDLVIAGNEYLLKEAMKFNPSSIIIPTVVDEERYIPKKIWNKGKVTLGWIGTESTLIYLKKLTPVFKILSSRIKDIELKIVCNQFPDIPEIKVIKKKWKYEEEIEDLHSFDIGLMPLDDDPWSRGKCGFKLLQYMACGIPCVCSPVGVNREIVKHGKSGFWAVDIEAWVLHISMLINDPSLRRRMGEEARKFVLDNYSLKRYGMQWIQAIKGVVKGP